MLKKRPAFEFLDLGACSIDDQGVASLMDNLGKDDFKKLNRLFLGQNKITDVGAAKLLAAINAGGLPELVNHGYGSILEDNPASASAIQAVEDSAAKRRAAA